MQGLKIALGALGGPSGPAGARAMARSAGRASSAGVGLLGRPQGPSRRHQSTTGRARAPTAAATASASATPLATASQASNTQEQSQPDSMMATGAHEFVHRHIGPREAEVAAMLAELGYSDMEQLIAATVPDGIRLKRQLQLGEPLTEHELLEQLQQLAQLNESAQWRSFIGLGYHNCVTPAPIMRNMFENPGWTTAYTAYQAEIAQGRLESLMNYQTMVSDLTGLDVANASLLDEATAAAEAMQVCVRVDTKRKRSKFLLSVHCHPQTRAVLETRAAPLGVQVDLFDELEPASVASNWSQLDLSQYCGLLVQYPNTQGQLFDLGPLAKVAHAHECLVVAATDLLACTLFKPPGDFQQSADIAVGSSQRLGVPLNYGGPHAAFFACKQRLVRSMPGRVVGLTRDSNGQPAFRFALQTREQHIRRDKATSNICTAQALLANMSAMYAVYHGPEGLRDIARAIHAKTALLARLVAPHARLLNANNHFDTLTVEAADDQQLARIEGRAKRAKINLRYERAQRQMSISLDEATKLGDVFELASLFAGEGEADEEVEKVGAKCASEAISSTVLPVDGALSELRRQSNFLAHPTFNLHRSEAQLVRYMKQLENKDISLAHSMIPLGSCTMKLNATSEMLASSWPQFANLHPFAPLDQCQGYAQLLGQLEAQLCEITGYDKISFQPNSGAQGEYAGLRAIKAYLESRGQAHRNVCLIPISAHGTNPASAQMAGFDIQPVQVRPDGEIDLQDLQRQLERHSERLACLMVTYPSTYGVFEHSIGRVCELVHANGGQVYLDGANMNAQVGLCRPGDYGSDVSHLNLHKTFCIPHGGGGPGAGPIGVKAHLAPFLPDHPLNGHSSATSFGSVSAAMWGSAAILPISWSYIRLMAHRLEYSSQVAILNANYMRKRLEADYKILFRGPAGTVAHEFILDCRPFKKSANVEAIDVAKRLQDFGLHAPTVSWPVSNTLMLEPTESEDKRQLDLYCDALLAIRQEIGAIEAGRLDRLDNPLRNAPHTQQLVCADSWTRPYSRQQAAFPAPFVTPANKLWPTVGRVDDTYGDTNLFCSCPPVAP